MTLCKGNILRSCKEETLTLVENLDTQKGKKKKRTYVDISK